MVAIRAEPPEKPPFAKGDFKKSVYNPFNWRSFVRLFNRLGLDVLAYEEERGYITGVLVKSPRPIRFAQTTDTFTISFVINGRLLTMEEIEEQIPKELRSLGEGEPIERADVIEATIQLADECLKCTDAFLSGLKNLPAQLRKEYTEKYMQILRERNMLTKIKEELRKRRGRGEEEGAKVKESELESESELRKQQAELQALLARLKAENEMLKKELEKVKAKGKAKEEEEEKGEEREREREREEREEEQFKTLEEQEQGQEQEQISPMRLYFEVGQYMQPHEFIQRLPKPNILIFPKVDDPWKVVDMVTRVIKLPAYYHTLFLREYIGSYVAARNISQLSTIRNNMRIELVRGEIPYSIEGSLELIEGKYTLVINARDRYYYYLNIGAADITIVRK
ncbi:MAG: hypothetical protein QW475_04580 [Candidatus Nitrosocaldus sp.]